MPDDYLSGSVQRHCITRTLLQRRLRYRQLILWGSRLVLVNNPRNTVISWHQFNGLVKAFRGPSL